MAQVESALGVLWTTHDPAQRHAADAWLREFQGTVEAWSVGLTLVQSAASSDAQLFGATLLINKLRGSGGGNLTPDDTTSLRAALTIAAASLPAGGRLRAQLLRGVALLLMSASEVVALALSEAARAGLGIDATLELLMLLPDAGVWLADAETDETQRLLLELVGHFYAPEAVAFPSRLPAHLAPSAASPAHRIAVLECAVTWTRLCDSGRITLGTLARTPCLPPLLAALVSDGSAKPPDESACKERRLIFELCEAALEHEPTVDVDKGSRLPHVPDDNLLALLTAVAHAVAPLVADSVGDGDDGFDEDEGDDEAALLDRCAVALSGLLLTKLSGLLAPAGGLLANTLLGVHDP